MEFARSGRRSARVFCVGIGLLGLLLLMACGGSAHSSLSKRPLRVALHAAPLSLDPHAENELGTFSFLSNICEGLTAFDQDLGVRGLLAQSWENPDALTWRFHLRHGVRFQDGRPLTAADVVYSLDRVIHWKGSGMRSYLVEVSHVKALSIDTVEIVTRRPYPILLNKLAFALIVPKGWPRGNEPPIGTGPYRFAGRNGEGKLELDANRLYWRGEPSISRVEISIVRDEVRRVAELESGKVDFVDHVSPDSIPSLERDGMRVVSSQGRTVIYLELNVTRPPFSDLRVRRAVNLAIDRHALVRSVLHGMGVPASQLVDHNVFGFAPDIKPVKQDQARARDLLAAAGYSHGFEVTLDTNHPRVSVQLSKQLEAIGIHLKIETPPGPQLFAALRQRKVTMFLGGVLAPTADASDLFDTKVHTRDSDSGYGEGNFSGYSNPKLDALIERTATTEGMAERGAALEQSMRLLMHDLPMIPLFVGRTVYAARPDLHFTPRLDERLVYFEMRW